MFLFVMLHTINWILIGGGFAVLSKKLGLMHSTLTIFNYAVALGKRIQAKKYILVAVIIGSLARGNINETSDIDMLVVRKKGFFNSVRICFFINCERIKAALDLFPIEIRILDDVRHVKFQVKETRPIVVRDPEKILENVFDRAQSFEEFTRGYL